MQADLLTRAKQSCGHCRECISGYRQCCPKTSGQKHLDGGREGAFSNYVIRHQDFVFPIPAEIESRHAGPLLCAGVRYLPLAFRVQSLWTFRAHVTSS